MIPSGPMILCMHVYNLQCRSMSKKCKIFYSYSPGWTFEFNHKKFQIKFSIFFGCYTYTVLLVLSLSFGVLTDEISSLILIMVKISWGDASWTLCSFLGLIFFILNSLFRTLDCNVTDFIVEIVRDDGEKESSK